MKCDAREYLGDRSTPPKSPNPAAVYRRLVRDQRICHGAFRLWHYLRDRADRQGECYPGRRLTCHEIGCNERSLQRWRQELVRHGYLLVIGRGARGVFRYRLMDGQGLAVAKLPPLINSSGGIIDMPVVAEVPPGSGGRSATVSNLQEVKAKREGETPVPVSLSPSERISKEHELKRVESRINDIREAAGRDATGCLQLDKSEKSELAALRDRQKELKGALGWIA